MHKDMQSVFLQIMWNDDDGYNWVKRWDFIGDEQYVEKDSAGNYDTECTGEFCEEDTGFEVLHFDQVAYDQRSLIVILWFFSYSLSIY